MSGLANRSTNGGFWNTRRNVRICGKMQTRKQVNMLISLAHSHFFDNFRF